MLNAQPSDISLDQAVAGMTLAVALCDAAGAVLLPQDATLTDATLAALRRRGLMRCVVWSDAGGADPAELARARALRLARLDHLFRHARDSEGGAMLLARLRAYVEGTPP